MDSIYLFDLASRRAHWLSARQTAVAGNIANIDTPGYRAQDVEPFVETLERTRLTMAATVPGHLGTGVGKEAEVRTADRDGWAVEGSGNSVTLEAELLKAGEVNRAFSLNTAIVKSFHGMLLTSVKG